MGFWPPSRPTPQAGGLEKLRHHYAGRQVSSTAHLEFSPIARPKLLRFPSVHTGDVGKDWKIGVKGSRCQEPAFLRQRFPCWGRGIGEKSAIEGLHCG